MWKFAFTKNTKTETILSRLRNGQTNITHFYLMESRTNPPMCNKCNVHIMVKHMLVDCSNALGTCKTYCNNSNTITIFKETDGFSISKLIKDL